MKTFRHFCVVLMLLLAGCSILPAGSGLFPTSTSVGDLQPTGKFLSYHQIMTDAEGNILPWYSSDLGAAYDHIIRIVFEWWLDMEGNPKEPAIPYYLMHQVWRPGPDYDPRGLGGDQLAMAMSSWRYFYAYSGDERAIDDMRLMANHVLANGLSKPTDSWPNLPYPYNAGALDRYDGDMIYGVGYTQPDKAGSLGYELLNLYKITSDERYLKAAIDIANTLAEKVQPGDAENSPYPFKVRADTGALTPMGNRYTTNYTGTLQLFEDLIVLGKGNLEGYRIAHGMILDWIKKYPMSTNVWGPFFEDIPGWSDTQINAVTMAMYIMDHRQSWGEKWQDDARRLLDWAILRFGNDDWQAYHVQVINEQTVYQAPGNSHTSRQASMELRYAELTGDMTYKANAIRKLNWATYMVDIDGKNRYLNDDIWLTDGYGDYIRHFLRSMAAAPELAPSDQDHLLRTTSVIREIVYAQGSIRYVTFDPDAQELLRISTFYPVRVLADGVALPRLRSLEELETKDGYTLSAGGDLPGVLRIHHSRATIIEILYDQP